MVINIYQCCSIIVILISIFDSRYVYGFIGFVLIILLLVGMTIRGKSLENAYLESLADDNYFVPYKQTIPKGIILLFSNP